MINLGIKHEPHLSHCEAFQPSHNLLQWFSVPFSPPMFKRREMCAPLDPLPKPNVQIQAEKHPVSTSGKCSGNLFPGRAVIFIRDTTRLRSQRHNCTSESKSPLFLYSFFAPSEMTGSNTAQASAVGYTRRLG